MTPEVLQKFKVKRLQRDITCAKIHKIINISAADIVRFRSNFVVLIDHVTRDVPRTFKINGLQRYITYQHQKSL